jgi:hypothetical protein
MGVRAIIIVAERGGLRTGLWKKNIYFEDFILKNKIFSKDSSFSFTKDCSLLRKLIFGHFNILEYI